MKYCPRCQGDYPDGLARCPEDGEALVESAAEPTGPHCRETEVLTGGAGSAFMSTGQLAGEIENLIFRVCATCHSAFAGGLEVCPQDGTRLVEHSMATQETFFKEIATSTLELKKYCPGCKRHYPLHVEVCEPCGSLLSIPTLGGATVRDRAPWRTEDVIDGKYLLLEEIGSGGFGTVYIAKHVSLGKRYAVKVLKVKLAERTGFRDRFHEEALKLSRLEDENIVRVFDFGEWKDGQYMVTEFVEGEDLGKLIYREKVPQLRAAKIMRQVAAALAEAHSKKIIHLDLKPANILLARRRGQDFVKVIDFGIAELYTDGGGKQQDIVMGTCSYMAPEHWRLEALDPRTDIYSFGVILYELLAGRQLFRRETVREFQKAHCEQAPTPLRKFRPDVSPELEKLVHRCIEKKPERRFQSAEEVEAALAAFVRREENVLGRWLLRAAAAAILLAALAGAAWGAWEFARDKQAPYWEMFRAEGPGLIPSAGANLTYETRAKKAEVILEARDDREVVRISARSAAIPGGERIVEGGKARVQLELDPGRNDFTATATDAAGNAVESTLVIRRLGQPSVTVERKIPTHTSKNPIEITIAGLEGGVKARIGGSLEPVEVEKDGDYQIRLENGPSSLTLEVMDPLSPEKPVAEELGVVRFRDDPLIVKATISPIPDQVVRLDGGGWLSSRKELEIEVTVKDARDRLRPGSLIPLKVNQVVLPVTPWTQEELELDRKSLRVSQLQPGDNQVTIETFKDLYDIASDETTLAVIVDEEPPQFEDIDKKEVTYYREDAPPRVRFKAVDPHLPAGEAGFALLDEKDQPLDPSSYRINPAKEGYREIQFLGSGPIAADGRHKFRIQARDRVGNVSGATAGWFTLLSDHKAPEIIEIASPAPGQAFRRNGSIPFSASVRDEFLETVEVRFEVPGDPPGKTFRLTRPTGDLWEGSIPIGPEGIAKPDLFTTLEPEFVAIIIARDASGKESQENIRLAFEWENGDQLRWEQDGSILVYHDAPPELEEGPFFMAAAEVSNRQYEKFLAAQDGRVSPPASPDWKDGRCLPDRLDLPVRGVSWNEISAYARWAGLELAGRDEWLAAALWDHAKGWPRRFPWGDRAPEEGAWWPIHAGKDLTAPAAASGDEKAFAEGKTPHKLAHLFGNVWELVLDRKTGKLYRLGGGFRDGSRVFVEDSLRKKYLGLDGKPEGEPLPESYLSSDLGFRCMLRLKGAEK